MKVALAYGKYALTIALWAGYVVFAFSMNEKLKLHVSGFERFALVSLSIVGASSLILNAAKYLSLKLFK
ncbi:hypothetical protein [Phenylobacterium sp.]|uniref:hypothetical protein n=1 Tax=Phenylobacterium sp. TaxID=1871053 RepID=UPI00271B1195|nr:hypothetical protein [Phenylobacterium sp.]MDO8380440.1 hypothetical protein [Phenylobacterium sp.]